LNIRLILCLVRAIVVSALAQVLELALTLLAFST